MVPIVVILVWVSSTTNVDDEMTVNNEVQRGFSQESNWTAPSYLINAKETMLKHKRKNNEKKFLTTTTTAVVVVV